MRLTRLYTPDISFTSEMRIPLKEEHAHYLLRVLRLEEGAGVILFNAESGGWRAVLNVVGKKAIAVLQEQIQEPQALSDIWLVASPIKKEAWEWVIEKSTELGVAALQPVLMDFTQNTRVNIERAKANMIEASQQCERTEVPELFSVEKLDSVLKKWNKDRVLYVALERSDAKPALDVFDTTKPGAILVGPEGGFSVREKELFLKYDFIKPISLGALILRAETASLAALSLWMAKTV